MSTFTFRLLVLAALLLILLIVAGVIQVRAIEECGARFEGTLAAKGIRDCQLADPDAVITLVKPTHKAVDFVVVDGVLVVRSSSPGPAKFTVEIR